MGIKWAKTKGIPTGGTKKVGFFAFLASFTYKKSFIFVVEELERDYKTKQRLGFRPEAPPPDFSNVKSRINNKHEKKYAKKPTKGKRNCFRY